MGEKKKTRENSIKMAKSLRSKWKRKMKAEKRVKYGEREDKRLIKMLEAAEELKKQDGQDAVMMTNEPKEAVITEEGDSMDTSVKPKYNSKTMKDEHGNYPAWMSMRRIQKTKKKAATPHTTPHTHHTHTHTCTSTPGNTCTSM